MQYFKELIESKLQLLHPAGQSLLKYFKELIESKLQPAVRVVRDMQNILKN